MATFAAESQANAASGNGKAAQTDGDDIDHQQGFELEVLITT